jgi:hypothetical protein
MLMIKSMNQSVQSQVEASDVSWGFREATAASIQKRCNLHSNHYFEPAVILNAAADTDALAMNTRRLK